MAPITLVDAARAIIDKLKGRERVVVPKDKIMEILPHRGRMLLLDEVVFTGQDEIRGRFAVTHEVCDGHPVLGDKLVFRGVDIIEMAAQTVGVSWGVQHPDFLDMRGMFRAVSGVKFSKPVFVGDLLEVVVDPVKTRDAVRGGPEKERTMIKVSSRELAAFVGKERKTTIEEIELTFIPPAPTEKNNQENKGL